MNEKLLYLTLMKSRLSSIERNHL